MMDWKYIFKLNPENLTEDDKDQLLTTIAWFDYDSQELDRDKFIVLLRLSQEVMKYKAEQVEALLAELDELAVRQGEEEARKQGVNEDQLSVRSKQTGSATSVDFEQKYRDVKVKLRQQAKLNQNYKEEIEKLQQNTSTLKAENLHLCNEVQSILNKEEGRSDSSESITDQYKELVRVVQQKNSHISQLLKDIEVSETDNLCAQEELLKLRDKLADATNHITEMTNEITTFRVMLNEKSDIIKNLTEDNEGLSSQVQDLVEAKQQHENQIDEFAEAIDIRVEKWKKILEEKDEEIQKLKRAHSSNSSITGEKSQVERLNQVIYEQEVHLTDLQTQLQNATKEMQKSTELLGQLTANKSSTAAYIDEQSQLIKNLKNQLQSAHKRSQQLQDDIEYAESISQTKEEDINELLIKLKDSGQTALAKTIEEVQKLRLQLNLRDKQVRENVRISNTLQNTLDELENENTALREKCGIAEEEQVNTAFVLLKKHKQQQELSKLYKQIETLENENLGLKLKRQETVQDQVDGTSKVSVKDEQKELIEENEALRKGLHEILESVQVKKESSKREITSETLEKLLKALDVRHVSGWYHPAMRLQAELHACQGVNNELREQLRLARLEKVSLQRSSKPTIIPRKKLPTSDKSISTSMEDEEIDNTFSQPTEKIDKISEIFETRKLYEDEKKFWKEKENDYQLQIQTFEDKTAILDAKLHEFINLNEDDYKKAERLAQISEKLVILNRKCVFLENSESKLALQIKNLLSDKTETMLLEKLTSLKSENHSLITKISNLENIVSNSIDSKIHTDVQNNLDSVTFKYRNLLEQLQDLRSKSEITILNESVKTLKEQKSELYKNLVESSTQKYISETVPGNIEILSKKLAEVETNEIREKQRGNHMSNLFNVVKEQLQKSEKRCTDLEQYNEKIKTVNTSLQENIKDLENKLINYVETTVHQRTQTKIIDLSETIQKLSLENEELKNKLIVSQKDILKQTHPSVSNDMEILNLKHQILDLQASSDDKALVARLSSDVVLARLSETQCLQKLTNLEMELKNCLENGEEYRRETENVKIEMEAVVIEFKQKISTLEEVLRRQRQQYLGSIPLISQEVFSIHLQQMLKDKESAFISLHNILNEENDCIILKEQLNKQMDLLEDYKATRSGSPEYLLEKIKGWHQERKIIYSKEIRSQRELEYKKIQLEQLAQRLSIQDESILKLQEELLQPDPFVENIPRIELTTKAESNNQETQTTWKPFETHTDIEITLPSNEIEEKDHMIEQLKAKVIEVEMNLSLFRTQIGDKQSQITFYEKHILDLQNKLTKSGSESKVATDDGAQMPHVEELLILKDTLTKLQESNIKKDASLLKYQTLLKNDRDEHSLAAARMQQEAKRLQDIITTQEKLYKELQESSIKHPGKAAIEQYIHQVHELEKHTDELHTNVSSLKSQLQASRQETVRWQTLANERLNQMDNLRAELEDQHQSEILVYKHDSERWRNEILKLKQMISKHRNDANLIEPDLKLIINEKDERIRELSISVKHAKNELNKISSERTNVQSPKLSEIESTNEQLTKELQSLKNRYEQVTIRERNAKDEVLKLKEQLLRKPISARSDKSEKELQLQKKNNSLEKEILDLRDKFEKQAVINEAHRITVTEDFEKWRKQKHFQQLSEKLKKKLDEKTEECEKLNQTCTGYKILIERLEREKHSLESKNKSLRNTVTNTDTNQLQFENEKLHLELEAVNSKLQMQHHHSGGLGAVMLQEKLEAQERKIAVLELTSKGSVEVRGELERLQNTIANLQKANLRLEAENLEMKLDLEKLGSDAPHLHDRIQHLESYIEVLKTENHSNHIVTESGDHAIPKPDSKRISELERTIFVLKRVVEKLQVENKRLQTGSRPCLATDRHGASEKLMVDYKHLKEQYAQSIMKISSLEEQLTTTSSRIKLLEKRPLSLEIDRLTNEVSSLRVEMTHKTQLLDKVKVLLHRAAIRERALVEEINTLKLKMPVECHTPNSV